MRTNCKKCHKGTRYKKGFCTSCLGDYKNQEINQNLHVYLAEMGKVKLKPRRGELTPPPLLLR